MPDVTDLKKRYNNGDRDFSQGDFSHAQLSFQILSQSIFSAADFSNANLSSAQLDNCDFKSANLSFSNLSGVNLSGSNLCNTNLEGANLTSANFQNAVYNTVTNFPQGIDPQSLGAINIDAPEPIPEPIAEPIPEIEAPSPIPVNPPTLSTQAPIPEATFEIETSTPSPAPNAFSQPIPSTVSSVPPTHPPYYAPIPTPVAPATPIPPASDWSQPTAQQEWPQQPSQSFNNTTTPTSTPGKKPNIGIIIFSALTVLTLGYCATQSTTAPSSGNRYKSQNPFESVSFPLSACGDAMPTNPNDYPVNLYPVFIDYSAYNLQEITNGYCIDAYPNTRANGTRAIQVASFTDSDRAQQFADFLRNRIGSGDVGYPNTFYQ